MKYPLDLLRAGSLLIAAAIAPAASGQSVMPLKLDLAAAVDRAIENNPRVRIADTSARIAELKIDEARAGRMPLVSASQSAIRSNNPVFVFGSLLEQGRFTAANFELTKLNHPNGINNFRSQVEARVPIFDQRRTGSQVAEANIGLRQQRLAADAARQQLRFDVIRSFYGTIVAGEMAKVALDHVAAAEANRKKTRDMADVGMATEADFLSAEVEFANASQHSLEAESGLITSLAALNITLGEASGTRRQVNGDLMERYFTIEEPEQLVSIAFENRPDYRQAELAIEAGRARTRRARGEKLPRVDAFGNYGYSSPYLANGSADYTVGASVTYNIFDAGRSSRIAQAAEAETLAELELKNLADRVRLEVIRAYQNYRTAKAKIQVSAKSVAQAEEARRIIDDRYRVGLTTFNEVLRAEAALLGAKQSLLNARYEYNVSYASVLLATGRLTDVRSFQ